MQDKTNDPLVSICLPTYNYACYLPQAIDSCLAQSYKQIELIIVDDASTDNSTELIRRFNDSRIRFLENPIRLGLVENWNKTLSLVRGEIIKFLFADDYLTDDAIERIVNVFECQDVALVFSAAIVIDAQGKQKYIHKPYPETRYLPLREEFKSLIKKGNYIGGPSSVAVRTSAIERAGRFDETLRFHAGLEMWLRIISGGNAYFIAEPLVYVRQHEGSETSRLQETGQILTETLKFQLHCLRNEQIRTLLSKSEVNQIIDQYENLSVTEVLRSFQSRSYRRGCKIIAIGALNSRIVHYSCKLLCHVCRFMSQKVMYKVTSRRKFSSRHGKISFSQSGEDLIVKYVFDAIGKKNPTYIDIGAHDPFYLNNTALFYLSGSRGINIEPDPFLFRNLARKRKRDLNLNIGISDSEGMLDFYIISAKSLSTFSKAVADEYVKKHGYTINSVMKVKVDTVSNIIARYCDGNFPDFLSIDVEGLDIQILKSIDYERSCPTIICVETISFSNIGCGVKDLELIEYLQSKGYMVYADTNINTIFVKKDRWIR